MDLSPARVLSPPHIPVLLQRHISTPGEIRTLTEPGLNRRPLPVGIREHSKVRARYSRTRWAGKDSNLRCFLCNGFTVRPPRRWSYRPISSKQSFSLILLVSRDSSCKHDCSRTPCCNKKPSAWIPPNRRPEIFVSSDDAHECLCFTGAFPHDNKTLLLSRRDR